LFRGVDYNNKLLSQMVGKKIVLKSSNIIGDYSINSVRGMFSSIKSPKFVLDEDTNIHDITDILLDYNIPTSNIVVQEILKIENNIWVVSLVTENEIVLEISYKNMKYLYVFDYFTGKLVSKETLDDRDFSELEDKYNIADIFHINKYILDSVGFNMNVEAFYDGKKLNIIQLRPIPNDLIVNECNDIDYDGKFNTRFVHGVYDLDAKILSVDEACSMKENKDIIVVLRDDYHIPWEEDYFIYRFENGLETVIVDIYNPTLLSHDEKELPNDINIRKYLKRIGITFLKKEDLLGKKVKIKSNGIIGEIKLDCIYDRDVNNIGKNMSAKIER
jgi:hypothetical protein